MKFITTVLFLCFGAILIYFSLAWFFDITVHDIGNVTPIQADHIDESNEEKLVYLTGDTKIDDILTDPLFGVIVSDVIKFKRVVEKFDGQDKGWSKNSSRLNSETFMPKKVKLGAFTLSSGLIDQMPHFQHIPMTLELFEQIPDNLSVQLGGQLHLNNGNYYVGQYPDNPQFGDLRIRFFVVHIDAVSIIAKQVGSSLVSYQKNWSSPAVELLKSGIVSMEKMITGQKNIPVKTDYFSQFRSRLPLYLLGIFTLHIGIYLIFWTWNNWLSALVITISLLLIIIAGVWISYLPMLGVSLIVIALGNLYFLKPAARLLTPLNFEPPEEVTLVQETVVPQKVW